MGTLEATPRLYLRYLGPVTREPRLLVWAVVCVVDTVAKGDESVCGSSEGCGFLIVLVFSMVQSVFRIEAGFRSNGLIFIGMTCSDVYCSKYRYLPLQGHLFLDML